MVVLCLPLFSVAQSQTKTRSVKPSQLLGVWYGKAGMKQADLEMYLEGEKEFISPTKLQDRLTGSFVLKKITSVPILVSIQLKSNWYVRDGYLCERLKSFHVGIVSKPDGTVVPPLMVAELVENLQGKFDEQAKSGRDVCNQLISVAPNTFTLRDGSSSMVTKFKRLK